MFEDVSLFRAIASASKYQAACPGTRHSPKAIGTPPPRESGGKPGESVTMGAANGSLALAVHASPIAAARANAIVQSGGNMRSPTCFLVRVGAGNDQPKYRHFSIIRLTEISIQPTRFCHALHSPVPTHSAYIPGEERGVEKLPCGNDRIAARRSRW